MREPALLVSVRDATEAQAALAGGAQWIDVKEPANGPLGRADTATIRAIIRTVDSRAPVSAALGEWDEALNTDHPVPDALNVLKCGTARLQADWASSFERITERLGRERFVLCAYADWQRVDGVEVDRLVDWAIHARIAGLLIDTAVKDGRGLFAWVEPIRVRQWIKRLNTAGLWCALAGGLHGEALRQAAELEPDVLAVRGAACFGRNRKGSIASEAVGTLSDLICRTLAAQ